MLAEAQDYDGAIAKYDSALLSQPSDATTLLYRSIANALRPKPRLDLAIQDAGRVIELEPSNWRAWKQKGDIHRRQGDLQAASEALENAVGFASGADRVDTQGILNSIQQALDQQATHAQSVELDARTQQRMAPGVTNQPVNQPKMSGLATSPAQNLAYLSPSEPIAPTVQASTISNVQNTIASQSKLVIKCKAGESCLMIVF